MLIFSQDVMLSKPEQEKARKKMFEKMKSMGFENAGIEFLFIETRETRKLEKLERKARLWKRFLEKNFYQTKFSIHAPWLPFEETNLCGNAIAFKNLLQLARFCDDFVDVLNTHVVTGMGIDYWIKNFSSIWQKEQAREIASEKLAELTDNREQLCIEIVPIVEEKSYGGCVGFIACLPSDFDFFLKKNKKLGMTIDTCHTGLVIESCKQIVVKRKWFHGFYQEDMAEINDIAKNGEKEFLRFGKRIKHLHYSDLGKFGDDITDAFHGAVPGGGQRSEKEMIDILKVYEKAFDNKAVSAVLEINETAYTKLVNTEKTLEVLKSYQYY